MPWIETTRPHHRRAGRGYASDLTDREWMLISPLMSKPSRLGRPRTTALRRVVDALLYVPSTGCQWRQRPRDCPPYSTVQGYFYRWAIDGTLPRINHALVVTAREAAVCEAGPTAGAIDSQSVKTAETVGITLAIVMKQATGEAVRRGVPEAAAREFMLGHVNIGLAIAFSAFQRGRFSDRALYAIAEAQKVIFKDNWLKAVFREAIIKRSVQEICNPPAA